MITHSGGAGMRTRERRRAAGKGRTADDLAPCCARTRAQLDCRGHRIGGQRLEQQAAIDQHHARRNDVDAAANSGVRAGFVRLRRDRYELERQGSADARCEHPAEQPRPRSVGCTTEHADVIAHGRQTAERTGHRTCARREQQHVRTGCGPSRSGHLARTVDRNDAAGATSRLTRFAAGTGQNRETQMRSAENERG
jgi:hypothetical protein